jgi:predicted enzyme related to lactoylglutathione lyase
MEVAVGRGVRLRIFATDPDRARAFYARVFGWSLSDDGHRHCWVITTGDDPRLGIDGPHPAGTDHTVNPGGLFVPTIHVPDVDAATAEALAAGGDVLVPRIPLPGVGWLVYLADTEGNLIGIMQDDPHAAWPRAPSPDPQAGMGPPGRPGSGRPGSGGSA